MVQGVGFRPFVYRLATELALTGWVKNTAQGVVMEVEGCNGALQSFCQRLQQELPPHAFLHTLQQEWQPTQGDRTFEILPSDSQVTPTSNAFVLPDLATCPDCLRELFNPNNRRYHYPFINCTHCGPRFSILHALPYDRPNTTMRAFSLCPDCAEEYRNPGDRRFHAQPNACPICGPQVAYWDNTGQVLATQENALLQAVHDIRAGLVLAIQGLGGFHLVVDARNETAVTQLRQRKQRPDKPFALMYPNLEQVQHHCWVSPIEAELLQSAAAPIVLLERCDEDSLAPSIAPRNPRLGVMLPYTPIHHLLLAELQHPIVATSGNRSDEPLCVEAQEALERLQGIADRFLVHNRPIARPVDDSIVAVWAGEPTLLRRARGYTPLPLTVIPAQTSGATPDRIDSPVILAVGGHLKNTVAFWQNNQLLLSQHLGDLQSADTIARFHEAIAHFQSFYEATPTVIACDAHPDYLSTQFAQQFAQQHQIPLIPVQHHQAHVLAGMADNQLAAPVLGIAWDGTGYGLDHTIWGGEAFHVTEEKIQRVVHLRPFPLPGGDRAAKEPWRCALGLLYARYGEKAFTRTDLPCWQAIPAVSVPVLQKMLQQRWQTPITSSMGRFFDAIASLLNLCQRNGFEGQAAMQVEFSQTRVDAVTEPYPFPLSQAEEGYVLDWFPLLDALLEDMQAQVPIGHITARFHQALANAVVAIAQQVGEHHVLLTGGCFQNRTLLEASILGLKKSGFAPHWHHQIPPNDGGIAVGQVMAVLRQWL
jgi:hydrogenase maturation protein HypF